MHRTWRFLTLPWEVYATSPAYFAQVQQRAPKAEKPQNEMLVWGKDAIGVLEPLCTMKGSVQLRQIEEEQKGLEED